LLLASRTERINDELDQAAADGWLVFDFRGSNPAFGRLLGAALSSEQPSLHGPVRLGLPSRERLS